MKIFISWSGNKSKAIAIALRDWLPMVIQAIDPYVSSEDIHKGERWSNDVSSELEASDFGIVCVTSENVNAPWIQFEAGALSKTISSARVCPLLFDVKVSEISDPFKQFQVTLFKKEDIKKLVSSINSSCKSGALEVTRLDTVFETWWPHLNDKLTAISESFISKEKASAAIEATPNKTELILEEILELTRQQQILIMDKHKEPENKKYLSKDEFSVLAQTYRELARIFNSAYNQKEDVKVSDIRPHITSFYKIMTKAEPKLIRPENIKDENK